MILIKLIPPEKKKLENQAEAIKVLGKLWLWVLTGLIVMSFNCKRNVRRRQWDSSIPTAATMTSCDYPFGIDNGTATITTWAGRVTVGRTTLRFSHSNDTWPIVWAYFGVGCHGSRFFNVSAQNNVLKNIFSVFCIWRRSHQIW